MHSIADTLKATDWLPAETIPVVDLFTKYLNLEGCFCELGIQPVADLIKKAIFPLPKEFLEMAGLRFDPETCELKATAAEADQLMQEYMEIVCPLPEPEQIAKLFSKVSDVDFDHYLQVRGYRDKFTGSIKQAKSLVKDFTHFQAMMPCIRAMEDPDALMALLVVNGYMIDDESVYNPEQVFVCTEHELNEAWVKMRDDKIEFLQEHGFTYHLEERRFEYKQKNYNLTDACLILSGTLFEKVVSDAKRLVGMVYDPALNCFRNGKYQQTTEEIMTKMMCMTLNL